MDLLSISQMRDDVAVHVANLVVLRGGDAAQEDTLVLQDYPGKKQKKLKHFFSFCLQEKGAEVRSPLFLGFFLGGSSEAAGSSISEGRGPTVSSPSPSSPRERLAAGASVSSASSSCISVGSGPIVSSDSAILRD